MSLDKTRGALGLVLEVHIEELKKELKEKAAALTDLPLTHPEARDDEGNPAGFGLIEQHNGQYFVSLDDLGPDAWELEDTIAELSQSLELLRSVNKDQSSNPALWSVSLADI